MANTLLFDLDGTLLDSVDDLTVAINNTLTSLDLKTITRDDVTLFIGKGAKVLVQNHAAKSLMKIQCLRLFPATSRR